MHPLSRPWGLLLLSLLPQIAFSDGPAQCFSFNGSMPAAAAAHEPCIPASDRNITTHSACCAIGQGDICTNQGLCFAQRSTSTNSQTVLFQGGCTDQTLEDENACNSPCDYATNGEFIIKSFAP